MNALQVKLPVACAIGANHAIKITIGKGGRIQRIGCACKPTDPEVTIMRAMGEITCLQARDWIRDQIRGSGYISSHDISREHPAIADLAESAADWMRKARSTHNDRQDSAPEVLSKVDRQAILIHAAVPRNAGKAPIVEAYYRGHGIYDYPRWGSYASLDIGRTRVATVCQPPGQASFALWLDPAFEHNFRRGDGTDLCQLCDAPSSRPHRASAKHKRKVKELVARLLHSVRIPLLDRDEAVKRHGYA